jgi:hypothetical protein
MGSSRTKAAAVAQNSPSIEAATKCNIDARAFTPRQWAYLLTYLEFLNRGIVPTLEQCCTACKVHRTTIWRWYQKERFHDAMSRIMKAHVDARDSLVDHAVQSQAMRGSATAIEANLRRRDLWDGGHRITDDVPTVGGHQGGIVNFYGLPQPPSRDERDRLNPPPGSNRTYSPPPLK